MNKSFVTGEINLSWLKEHSLGQLISEKMIKNYSQNGFLLAILAAVAASSKAVLVKLIYQETTLSPLELLTARLLVAAPIFALLAFYPWRNRTNQASLPTFDWRIKALVVWLGFSGYYFASLTDFIGLSYISAGLERLVLFTYPTLVLLIDSVINRSLPKKKTIYGVLLCYAGLAFAFSHDLKISGDPRSTWIGVGWVALSGLSFALYYIGTNKAAFFLGAKRLTGYAGLIATACTLIHFMISSEFDALKGLSSYVWSLVLIMAIVCTILPSLLLTVAIRKIGPSTAANIGALGPVLTILLAWLLLNESLSIIQLSGMALVLIGIRAMKK